MTTAFWQQDNDKVILTFLGPASLTPGDVDVVLTQNSLRAGIRSTGVSVCDGSLFNTIKNATAYYGIKTYPYAKAVVLVIEKAHPGESWPTLFAEGSPENQSIYPVICTVQSFSEYTASDPTELSFPAGANILVLYQDPSGWWNSFYQGAVGNLPSNFVTVLADQPLTPDIDDPNNVTYLGRGAGGMGMGMGMGMPMPGMGRGMGFGAGLNGELGNALKRRTQMIQQGTSGGGGGGAPHRPPPPSAAQQAAAQQAEMERQRQEQEAAAAAAAAAAEEERRKREEEERYRREEEERRRREEEERQRREAENAAAEAEKQRKAAEADALAQELARKQMEAMQAAAAAAAAASNPDIPVIDNLVPGVTTVKATSPYEGGENELSFSEGDLIKVWQTNPSGWWEGECRGVKGWFPSNFVVLVPSATPAAPRPSSSSSGDVLGQALDGRTAGTLRHSSRAKGPSKRPPTMHCIPKIQTWDSTEQSPEAGAAAAAQEQAGLNAPHRPLGGVGIFPMPTPGGRGSLPPRGGRGAGRAGPTPPARGGGMAPARGGGAGPLPARGGGRGGLPTARGGASPFARGGRSASLRGPTEEPQSQPVQQPAKPLVVRKPAPPRPEGPPAGAASGAGSSQSLTSSTVTDPSKMNAPKNWGLPVPVGDFCAQAAKLMKSVSAPGVSGSPNLPDVKNANSRALAVCTSEGQVFVAGDNVGPSAQGAIWPLLQAMLPQTVTRNLYSNRAADDTKVSTAAQNGCCVSGAIASCSAMIDQRPNDQPWDRLAHFSSACSAICGCSIGFDMGAYAKSKKHCDIAWATAYAMKGAGAFSNNVADVMDLFFQLSSVQLTLPAAARIAAALADSISSGTSLPSREDALKDMRSFGLINGVAIYGGESGLVIAAVPKVGGIAFYCPHVNTTSHQPVVGREFFKALLEKYQL